MRFEEKRFQFCLSLTGKISDSSWIQEAKHVQYRGEDEPKVECQGQRELIAPLVGAAVNTQQSALSTQHDHHHHRHHHTLATMTSPLLIMNLRLELTVLAAGQISSSVCKSISALSLLVFAEIKAADGWTAFLKVIPVRLGRH